MNFQTESAYIRQAFREPATNGIATLEDLLIVLGIILKEHLYEHETQHGIILHALRIHLITLAKQDRAGASFNTRLLSDRESTAYIFNLFMRAAKPGQPFQRKLKRIQELVLDPKAREDLMKKITQEKAPTVSLSLA